MTLKKHLIVGSILCVFTLNAFAGSFTPPKPEKPKKNYGSNITEPKKPNYRPSNPKTPTPPKPKPKPKPPKVAAVDPNVTPPSKPALNQQWKNYTGAGFVKLGSETDPYKKFITRVDVVQLPVSWRTSKGTTSWKVLVDGKVLKTGTGLGGHTVVPITKGGILKLVVRVCNAGGCKDSNADKVSVADTYGSQLQPLVGTPAKGTINYAQHRNKIVGAYFVEWGVYSRKFFVENIPANNLTHIIYGFIPMCGKNESLKKANLTSWNVLQRDCKLSKDFQLVIHDQGAALFRENGTYKAKTLDGKAVAYGGIGKGTFGHLMALKKAHPNLKVIPSIGGWTLSDPFFAMKTQADRNVFVASARDFLETWKFFDGIDIDWESPGKGGATPSLANKKLDGPNYVALIRDLRVMLDKLGRKNHRKYELTTAIIIGHSNLRYVDYGKAQQYLDNIFLMSYDFYGAWSNQTGHQTALYCGSTISNAKCHGTGAYRGKPEYTLANGTKILLNQGVPAKKLVVGAAFYGRGWTGVTPKTSTPMGGVGRGATGVNHGNFAWEKGTMDYRGAMKFMKQHPSAKMIWDNHAKANYIYYSPSGTLISLDTPRSIAAKGTYLQSLGLGGIFSWEMSGDSKSHLLNAMNKAVGNKPGKTTWSAKPAGNIPEKEGPHEPNVVQRPAANGPTAPKAPPKAPPKRTAPKPTAPKPTPPNSTPPKAPTAPKAPRPKMEDIPILKWLYNFFF